MLPLTTGIPNNIIITNYGVKCDCLLGPCSCGAWHEIRNNIMNSEGDVLRAYIFFLICEGKA